MVFFGFLGCLVAPLAANFLVFLRRSDFVTFFLGDDFFFDLRFVLPAMIAPYLVKTVLYQPIVNSSK